MSITKIEQVIKEYCDVFYMEDTNVIPLCIGVTAQSLVEGDPVWLWLVGGSSSGKTEVINALTGLKFVIQVSTLTENTFLSGAKAKGKETSLLKEIKNGCIVMKDFTSILSMNNEKREAIIGQMREIFDGKFTKATGTGDFLKWEGKINFIAGVTEAIHAESDRFNQMGTRNLFYTLPEQDRIKTTFRAIENGNTIKFKREHLKEVFSEYINYLVGQAQQKQYELPKEIQSNIVYLTDFVSRATTGVVKNYRGEMQLVMSPNMPMRNAAQAAGLAKIFMAMNDGVLADWGERIIYKTALDCIPKQRKMVLGVLARYREVTTKGVGIALGYSTDLVSSWLADLDALRICKRVIDTEAGKTRWILSQDYRQLMIKYDGIQYKDEIFTGTDSESNYVEPNEQKEQDKEIEEKFKLW